MKTAPWNSKSAKQQIALVLIMGLILTLTLVKRASAQTAANSPSENQTVLIAQNRINQQVLSIHIGQSIQYKTASFDAPLRGTITSITDSTISLRDDLGTIRNLVYQEIEFIRIPRKAGRIFAGVVVTVYGAVTINAAIELSKAQGDFLFSRQEYQTVAAIDAIVGVAEVIGGIALTRGKKINLKTDWQLKAVQIQANGFK